LTDGNIVVQGKEARLDALLQGTLAHNSKEYIAVMSLFYNLETLGQNLGTKTWGRFSHNVI
jgi:hypothetical protein